MQKKKGNPTAIVLAVVLGVALLLVVLVIVLAGKKGSPAQAPTAPGMPMAPISTPAAPMTGH